jgi:protein TonB
LSPGKKRVYVQFKISKTGDIVDVRARGPHARLEKEAVRVVELLPKMEPGKQRGRPVGVKYTLPITLLVE